MNKSNIVPDGSLTSVLFIHLVQYPISSSVISSTIEAPSSAVAVPQSRIALAIFLLHSARSIADRSGVGVGAGVTVAVGAGVGVGAGVTVAVGMGVDVRKDVAVGVAVTTTVPPHPATASIPSIAIPTSTFILLPLQSIATFRAAPNPNTLTQHYRTVDAPGYVGLRRRLGGRPHHVVPEEPMGR